MTLPVLLVYGNCQAEAIVTILRQTPAAELFDVVYLRSFEHPIEGRATLDAQTLARCSIVWEQRDYEAFPYGEDLPESVSLTRFPSLDLNVLWPYTCNNPYNAPEPPKYPFGPFHYGDRTVVNGISKNLPEDEILERALNVWTERPIDIARLLEIERARLHARDLYCDVRMGNVILDAFRHERCFYTRDHPTLELLCNLLRRLLARSCAIEPRLATLDFEDIRARFPAEPLGEIVVPVHPAVAERLELHWAQPEGTATDLATYTGYYREMIRYGLSHKS